MHPDVLRALAVQRLRDLHEEVANKRRSRAPGSLNVQTPPTGRHRIFALRRAVDPSPVRSNLPAAAMAPGRASTSSPASTPTTVVSRHDWVERKAA
jgi:hypothetical protein